VTRAFESIGPGYVISGEKPDHHNNDGLRLSIAGNLPREQIEWLVEQITTWLHRTTGSPRDGLHPLELSITEIAVISCAIDAHVKQICSFVGKVAHTPVHDSIMKKIRAYCEEINNGTKRGVTR
jgi:hypothetical protein